MFGFNKKKKEEKAKKQNGLDKILMGMIVGGAIGSVLGVGLAPKKGAETRKDLGKQAGKLLGGARQIIGDTAGKIITAKPSTHTPTHPHKSPEKIGQKSIPEEK